MEGLKEKVLFKELDLIDATITRLDTQMQKNKHFCILIWLGVLGFLFSEYFTQDSDLRTAVKFTVFIPMLFWIMDFYWRKALLQVSWRQKLMSHCVNNNGFENEAFIDFPILDPTGGVYKMEDYPQQIKEESMQEVPIYIKALYYKEAKWFFPSMIIVSLVLSQYCC